MAMIIKFKQIIPLNICIFNAVIKLEIFSELWNPNSTINKIRRFIFDHIYDFITSINRCSVKSDFFRPNSIKNSLISSLLYDFKKYLIYSF